jgi:hypothetical protein
MRTRLSTFVLFVVLSGSAPLHAAPSGGGAIRPATGRDFSIPQTVRRILRLVPKAMGDRLSPPIPAPVAPSTAPRCATVDCRFLSS